MIRAIDKIIVNEKTTKKVGIVLANIAATMNEENDLHIFGSIIEDDYKLSDEQKFVIQANIMDINDNIVYTLRDWQNRKLFAFTGYDSFSLSFSAIERFVEIDSIKEIEMFVTVEHLDE